MFIILALIYCLSSFTTHRMNFAAVRNSSIQTEVENMMMSMISKLALDSRFSIEFEISTEIRFPSLENRYQWHSKERIELLHAFHQFTDNCDWAKPHKTISSQAFYVIVAKQMST